MMNFSLPSDNELQIDVVSNVANKFLQSNCEGVWRACVYQKLIEQNMAQKYVIYSTKEHK